MKNNKLNITEVSVLIGKSPQTINMWYAWKRKNPNNEIGKLLPEYEQIGNRQLRRWNREDIWKFIEFEQFIQTGRNGFMGDITQKYVKKGEKE